jgi:hypothetical protein
MEPDPETIYPGYRGSGKLEGRRALLTGGDSGIGRAVAVPLSPPVMSARRPSSLPLPR